MTWLYRGPVELVVAEPVPELFPGLQQHVMGDLNTVLPQDQETLGAEDVDDRVDVAAIGGPESAGRPLVHRRLANWPSGVTMRQLGEYQAGRVLLGAGQGLVRGLGAAVDRVGDAARPR